MKCEIVKFPVPLLQTNVFLVPFSLFEALDESLSFAMNGSLIKSALHAFRDGDISSNFNTLFTVATKFSNFAIIFSNFVFPAGLCGAAMEFVSAKASVFRPGGYICHGPESMTQHFESVRFKRYLCLSLSLVLPSASEFYYLYFWFLVTV